MPKITLILDDKQDNNEPCLDDDEPKRWVSGDDLNADALASCMVRRAALNNYPIDDWDGDQFLNKARREACAILGDHKSGGPLKRSPMLCQSDGSCNTTRLWRLSSRSYTRST